MQINRSTAKALRRKAVNASRLCAFAVMGSIFLGCQPEMVELPPFEGQRAYDEVAALLEFTPRDAGTPNGKKAAEHILQRLEAFGIEVEIDTFKDKTPEGQKTFHNVSGRIPGKNNLWIVLGSHFDTMPGIDDFPGANDSGSSTGVLLELARMAALARDAGQVPDIGLIFTFFDGEEGIAEYIPGDGLHGSRHMVKSMQRSGEIKAIKAMVLLDMIGDKDLHFTVPYNSSQVLVKELLKAAHATGHRDRFSLARDSIITDDHQPFLDARVPAIDIIDFKFGSEPGLNDYWHTSADNLSNISTESLEITGEITLQLLKKLAYF
ncbi:M28 family peptidase [Pontiella sulfatireligans]|uniref:Aminopeptidase YwaD n=1 Tax=Pontiella sulfatireligans TaxID=2750658 RepID=A0A6C2UG59_9BACT|nr:M28 family peptidase [Pontiella sulfatireligans]VGO18899.1 Aminopeptidase YwaD [Pontiella sulfatireligans]